MGTSGRRPREGEPGLLSCLGGLVIKVINDLHVVSNEANWSDDNRLHALFGKTAEVIDNVRFKPRVAGSPRPRAIGQVPLRHIPEDLAHLTSDPLTNRLVLRNVIRPRLPSARCVLHRVRDGVSDENDAGSFERSRWDPHKRLHQSFRVSANESRRLVEGGYLVDLHIGDTDVSQSSRDLLAILTAPGVTGVGRGDNR